MAKFNLKKAFKKALDLVFDTRDAATASDDFARAAFKREGFTVLHRDSIQPLEQPPGGLLDATEAVYTIASDKTRDEFSATVYSGFIVAYAYPEIGAVVRQSWIGNIKPKP